MTQPTTTDGVATVTVPAAVYTATTAYMVRVQAFTDASQPGVNLLGLPGDSAAETRDRLRAAVINSGLFWPTQPIVLRVFPHDVPVADSGLDAAFAIALLAASGQVPIAGLTHLAVLGELGLDGALRTAPGIHQRATAIAAAGLPATVALGDLNTAVRILGDTVRAAGTLHDLVAALRGAAVLQRPVAWPNNPGFLDADLADLSAQHPGRRPLEVAAAGGHHLALIGPPGSGRIMLAERLPALLADTDERTAEQVAHAYRSAGLLEANAPVLRRPPWQAPHHTSSIAALTGTPARPSAVALAHGGVLFLNDAAEFPDRSIQALRVPLRDGHIRLAGADRGVQYPARFQLVLATPGCPNTWQHQDQRCDCPAASRRAYLRRLSPLLDLVELRITLPATSQAMTGLRRSPGEPSGIVAARVARARATAATRWAPYRFATNATAATAAFHTDVADRWSAQVAALMTRPAAQHLSVENASRVLAVAWTLADLARREEPGDPQLAEAIALHGAPVPGQDTGGALR